MAVAIASLKKGSGTGHFGAPCGGSRRTPGLSARRSAGQGGPYLRPLYDALYDILGQETYQKYRRRASSRSRFGLYAGEPSMIALSFLMRPKLHASPNEDVPDAPGFWIEGSDHRRHHAVDLPRGKTSGLVQIKILRGVEGIGFCYLHESDVVRHPLVQRIIQAYDSYDKSHS